MWKQAVTMEFLCGLGVFLLMFQGAVQVSLAQLQPARSTGFCEAFVSPTSYKCTEEVVLIIISHPLPIQTFWSPILQVVFLVGSIISRSKLRTDICLLFKE